MTAPEVTAHRFALRELVAAGELLRMVESHMRTGDRDDPGEEVEALRVRERYETALLRAHRLTVLDDGRGRAGS
jgi:hypothetical protein